MPTPTPIGLHSLVAVALGGALGASARFAITNVLAQCSSRLISVERSPCSAIAGTFVVNMLGCLLIGIALGMSARWEVSENARLFCTVGLLGGFTTFSALSVEALALMRAGQPGAALLYGAASFTVGITATFIGIRLAGG